MPTASTSNESVLSRTSPASRQAAAPSLIIAVICLILAWPLLRPLMRATPSALARTQATPVGARLAAGAWHWLENPSGPNARLMRASGEARAMLTAEAIPAFDGDDRVVVAAMRAGKLWSVLAIYSGDSRRTVWSGDSEPRGLKVIGDHVYFLIVKPGALARPVQIPALGPQLVIMGAPLAGGEAARLAELPESDGNVLGARGDELYVRAARDGNPASVRFYAVSERGGTPRPVAGDAGAMDAMVTRSGRLYWVTPTRESTNDATVVCVRRLGDGGRAETVREWLPAGGRLFDTNRGPVYVDGSAQPAAWILDSAVAGLPVPAPLSRDYSAVAAGGGEMLVREGVAMPGAANLLRIGLP